MPLSAQDNSTLGNNRMDKNQAEAVAEAILDPLVRAQREQAEARLEKQAAANALLARRHRMGWFMLVGAGAGVAVSVLAHVTFTRGLVVGALTGAVIGWLVTRR